MKNYWIIPLLAAASLMAGCVSVPVTPQQFRAAYAKAGKQYNHSYIVDRPYRSVMSRIARRTERCLHRRVVREWRARNGYGTSGSSTISFTPSLRIGRRHSAIYLQMAVVGTGVNIAAKNKSSIPAAGWYILAADVYRDGPRRTRFHVMRSDYEKLVGEAIHNWADGRSMGCPDMAKVK